MRALVDLSVRRPVTVVMTAMAVAAFGFVGYSRLSLELFPDFTYPSITIQTEFPDTAPQEVESLITRPVEEAVGVLQGLQGVHSISRSGTSEVTLEFDWGSDMDLLSMEVREKLDRLILPQEAEEPIVLRFDPSLEPIVRMAVAGGDLGRMRHLAELRIKPDFETLQGVAAAQVKGGLEEEIQIDVDQERLAAIGIPLDRIRQAVGVANVNVPGGVLRGEESQYLIRTVNEFDDLDEIRDLIIGQNAGATVRLGEVAEVRRGAREREEITRVNGQESVEISIFKEGNANTVTVARLLRDKVAEWQGKLPAGETLTVLFDQSGFIQNAVDEVRDAAVVGGALAILVLFIFLRDFRSTLIIATSIPLSVLATFLCMYRLDISLNVMSLGGLTLGIGMLVDSSIVVLENIFRRREAGAPLREAAIDGTSEVGAAVVASTLTTVAVFLPNVFVEGIAGQLFKDQAMTVTLSLMASLVVAITVIPMLSAAGSGARVPGAVVAGGAREAAGSPMTLGRFSRAYDLVVRSAVARPWVTLGVAVSLFAASLQGLRWIDAELIPPLSQGEFYFEVSLPEGTALSATDRMVQRLESAAAAEASVARHYATVGSRIISGGMSLNTKAEHLGQLNVVLDDGADPGIEAATAGRLRDRFLAIPDLEIKLGRPSYFTLKTPVEVIVYGEHLEDLQSYSLRLAAHLENVPGLVDVRSSLEAGNPELQVIFNRRRLAQLGLEMGSVSETLRNRVLGVVPTRFREEDRLIDIRLRNREQDRASTGDVRNLVISNADATQLRLDAIADVQIDRGPAEIHRLQQQRAAVVTANLKGRSLRSAIAAVEDAIDDLPPPLGVSTELGGQNREMKVSFDSLMFAMGLAVFLVYLVMASTFESFIHPLIVLFTIPLGLIGVVIGLLVTGTSINVMVLLGGILLAGIVVNNAIVLIDAINRLRRLGAEKAEAVVESGHIRLRPILMTTGTTILGIVPMMLGFGEGSELRTPLAVTIAFGLFIGTILTLVVIPAAYMIVPSRVELDSGPTGAATPGPAPSRGPP